MRRMLSAQILGALVLPVLTLATPAPLAAQTLSPEAEILRQDTQRFVDQMVSGAADGAKISAAGPVTVRDEAGGAILATLPAISIVNPQNERLTLPGLTIRMVPQGEDLRQVDMKLVGTPTLVNAAGTSKAEISIGQQSMTGLWRRSIRNFESGDLSLRNISVKIPAESFEMIIGRIGIEPLFKEVGAGLWNGAYDIKIQAVMAGTQGKPDAVRVGFDQFAYSVKIDGRFADYVKRFGAVGADTDPNFFDVTKKKPEELPGFVEFLGGLPDLFQRLDGSFRLDALKVWVKPNQPPVSIEQIRLASGLSGDGKSAAYRLALGADAISIPAGMVPIDAKLLPQQFNIDLALADLPLPALWDMGRDEVKQGVSAPPPAPVAGKPAPAPRSAAEIMGGAIESAGGKLLPAAMAAVQKTPPRLDVKSVALSTPESNLSGAGQFVYTPTAPTQATGKLDLRLVGLEKLIERVSAMPDSSDKQNIVVMLTMLRGMAKPVPAAGGAIDHQIDLVLDPAGKVLVNGVDLAPMLPGGKK